MVKESVYLDNAATTRMDKRVLDEMTGYLTEKFYNPSASYVRASAVKAQINRARMQVATLINASSDEIYFTSGGTEADVSAIMGVFEYHLSKGLPAQDFHMITSSFEHPAILNTCKRIETLGAAVSYVNPDSEGFVHPEAVAEHIRYNTSLISVMLANNEIGTIQDIAQISELAHDKGIILHSDCVQAFGHIPIDVKTMGIDLLSCSGHKIFGPKGIGAIYIKQGTRIKPLITGGGQEKGFRSGTENTAAIAGFGAAARIACEELQSNYEYESKLTHYLARRLTEEIPDTCINGAFRTDTGFRLPGNLNISFKGIEGSSLIINLDMRGIYCSTGSACSQASGKLSHVLKSIGLTEDRIRGSLRLTLSHLNTYEEIDRAIEIIKDEVNRLRSINLI